MKSDKKRQHEYDLCWEEAFRLYRGVLEFYAAYLLPCGCANDIVKQVEGKVQNVMVADEFKVGYLLRTMAQIVIPHLRECPRQSDVPDLDLIAGRNAVESLPTQERLVYFLRDILEYRTRDASLLLGISDEQVEKLLLFARRRVDRIEEASKAEVKCTHWQYFCWSFSNIGASNIH